MIQDVSRRCASGARCLEFEGQQIDFRTPHFEVLASMDSKFGDKVGDPNTVSSKDLKFAMQLIILDAINKKVPGFEKFKNDANINRAEARYISGYFGQGWDLIGRYFDRTILSWDAETLGREMIGAVEDNEIARGDGFVTREEASWAVQNKPEVAFARLAEKPGSDRPKSRD